MRHASWIRFASLAGLAISLLVAGANVFFVLNAPGNWASLDLTAGTTTYFTFAGTTAGKAVGLLALALDTAAHVLFWLALWALGRHLDGAISDARIALAFRRLALAFGGFVLLRGLAIATLLAAFWAFGGRSRFALDIGDTGLLLGALAGLIAWSVARLLKQAGDVAAENAGFV
jgi:hypothetical protein